MFGLWSFRVCVCVCVPLSVHARAVLQASTLLGNACVPMSVCVCVCVCVRVMTVRRDTAHTHRSAASAFTPPRLK